MTTPADHLLDEPCRRCSSREDVRLVRPLVSGGSHMKITGRAIALCAACRAGSRRKWKWPSPDAARSAEYAAAAERKGA